MPDLETELREALTSSAHLVTAADLRHGTRLPAPSRRVIHRGWLIAACIAVVVALATTLATYRTHHHAAPAVVPASPLVGNVWSINSVTHADATTQIPVEPGDRNRAIYALYFLADGKWAGGTQFTSYEGTYTATGNDLTTHRGGEQVEETGDNTSADTAVASLLEALKAGTTSRFAITGNTLTLDVAGNVMVATRPTAGDSPLLGRTWRITQVRHGGAVEQMVTGPTIGPIPTLSFGRNGVLGLADGSFIRYGRYAVAGSSMTLRDVLLQPLVAADADPAAKLLNSALRAVESPGVVATTAISGSRLTLLAGGYTFVASLIGSEPMPTPPPIFAPYAGRNPPAFVGYAWKITAVEHNGKHVPTPLSLGGDLTFTTDGQFIGSDSVSGQTGSYDLTRDGYVPRTLISSGGAIAAPVEAARQALLDGVAAVETTADIKASVAGTTLTVSAGDYTVTATRGAAVHDITDLIAVTDPTKLVDITWTLNGISEQPEQVGGRPTFQAPDAAIPLTFIGPVSGVLPVTSGCRSATASLTTGQIMFHATWSGSAADCPSDPQLGDAQNAFVFTVLAGADFWSIYQGTLTIGKAGIGSLRFSQ